MNIFLPITVKPVLSCHSKRRPKIGFQDQLSLNVGQKEHSAILSTFIKLPFVIKIFVLSIFEWPLKTGLTVVFIYALGAKKNCLIESVLLSTYNI